MNHKQSVPTGVKIIAILVYIAAIFSLLFGLMFLIGTGFITPFIGQIPLIGALGAGLFILGGVIMIGLGVLYFFIGRGLWNARPWARIVMIVFSIIGILMAIYSMIVGGVVSNVLNLLLNGLIGGYLLFSKKVKEAFV